MPKRIILCLDGTWDSADEGLPNIPTNVARLSRMIARQGTTSEGNPIEQVVYYQAGIGTGRINQWDKLYQGITGFGVRDHLISAYHFIATNYSAGDEIFLFGYSRGAYTARALGWFMTKLGVLKPEDLDLFPGLFKCFKADSDQIVFSDDSLNLELRGWSDDGRRWYSGNDGSAMLDERGTLKPRTRMKTKPVPVEIRVEGVWDTVGSLGLPDSRLAKILGFNKKFQFYNTALNDKIHHAFQALAIDEHRGAFTPSIWYLEPEFKDKVNLKQCWFPGFHGDVGGGVAGPLGRNHLAIEDITLAWMCDQVDGLLTFDEEESSNILGEIKEKVGWGVKMDKDPTGFLYTLGIAGSSMLRTPGSYHKIPISETSKPEDGHATNETIHPSIKLLIDDPDAEYFPKALDAHTDLKMVKIPRWRFIDNSESGRGAFWHRPAVKDKLGNTTINIKEHVIKEWHNRNNFEARLLPRAVQDRLYRRNHEELGKLYQSPYTSSTYLASSAHREDGNATVEQD